MNHWETHTVRPLAELLPVQQQTGMSLESFFGQGIDCVLTWEPLMESWDIDVCKNGIDLIWANFAMENASTIISMFWCCKWI